MDDDHTTTICIINEIIWFTEIYDACQYTWNIGRPPTEWYHDMKPSIRRCLAFLHKAVSSTWFEYTICKIDHCDQIGHLQYVEVRTP